MPARLSVNLNKIALLRNSRGADQPNVLRVAQDCIRFGADGITVHPRPDGRHILRTDVYELAQALSVEFNIEGYPSEDFIQMAPDALTSSAGWIAQQAGFLRPIVAQFKAADVRTSLFCDTNPDNVKSMDTTGTDRIELYTGPYAVAYPGDTPSALAPYVAAARVAEEVGLGLNAGHDLNQHNLTAFAKALPGLLEVSIGHALIIDALYDGLERTIQGYLRCLRG
jgi:pyridoxine 5-phosphate synthase